MPDGHWRRVPGSKCLSRTVEKLFGTGGRQGEVKLGGGREELDLGESL